MADNPAKILLVDDDPDLLRLLAIRLKSTGYNVTTAESGERALAAIAAELPQLVITDLRMAGMDGLALFDSVQRDHPALPVIILTAHGNIPDAVAATKRGVFGYLTKPYDSAVLIEQVEAALRLSGTRTGEGDDSEWRSEIITRSRAMEDLLTQARLVAAGDASVFLSGESGSGKELMARAIHKASRRRSHAFVAVNCGAIPEQLLESELFGHIKGSFTGATKDYKGLFQAADVPRVLAATNVSDGMTNALQERDALPVAVGSLWRFEGPRELNGAIDSGRMNEIAIHPSNSLIMYATAPAGGL